MDKKKIRGYGEGKADTVVSVDEVHEQSSEIKQEVSQTVLLNLSNNSNFLEIKNLKAGYGKMEILHDFNLTCDKGQSLCLIGPNGAGKSTVTQAICASAHRVVVLQRALLAGQRITGDYARVARPQPCGNFEPRPNPVDLFGAHGRIRMGDIARVDQHAVQVDVAAIQFTAQLVEIGRR